MQNSSHGSKSSRHLSSASFRTRPRGYPAVLGLALALAASTGPAVASEPEGDLELRLEAPSPAASLVELGPEDGRDPLAALSLRLPPGADRLKIRVDGTGLLAVPSKVHLTDPGPGSRGEDLTADPSKVHLTDPGPGSRGEDLTADPSKVHLPPPTPSSRGDKSDPPSACDLDWRSFGGTPQRNGVAASVGPGRPRVRWSGSRFSIIAWPVFLDGKLAVTVRQPSFQEPGGSLIVAVNRSNGAEEWVAELPYEEGDWHHWIAAVDRGRVYAARSGNGASVPAKLYALSANDGSILWESQDEVTAGAYDGVVLAQDGDLIVGSFQALTRIDAVTGQRVWRSSRQCSVGGSCGAAMGPGQEIYVADVAGGGHRLVRYDAATGQRLYESEVMPGFTLQDVPFVGTDGTVYLARTQNNPLVDFLYAFDDLGYGFALRWIVPSAWVTVSVHAVPGDGTLYMVAPGGELLRLDAASGATLASAGVLEGLFSVRMAVDAAGKLYVSDGVTSLETPATLYGFNPDLTLRWTEQIPRINIGGPGLGADGFLTVAGIDYDLWAYKNARSAPACP